MRKVDSTRWLLLALLLELGCGTSATAPGGGPIDDGLPADQAMATASADLSSVTSVPDMTVATTWSNFAQTFFQNYCVSCHPVNGQGAAQDFRQYSQVQANATLIACGVNPGPNPLPGCPAFPPPRKFPIGNGPKPTDEERARLVQWFYAGLPM